MAFVSPIQRHRHKCSIEIYLVSKLLSNERALKEVVHVYIITRTTYQQPQATAATFGKPNEGIPFQKHQCSTLAVHIKHRSLVNCICTKQPKLNPRVCYPNITLLFLYLYSSHNYSYAGLMIDNEIVFILQPRHTNIKNNRVQTSIHKIQHWCLSIFFQ